MQECWYSGGSTGTLYLFLTYVEVDLLSWGGQCHPDSPGNSLVSLLENNHRNKAFLDQTGVINRTNAIGALLLQFFHSCMSKLVGCSCGNLMSEFDTSGRWGDRISVFIMLPESVKMSDMNKS